MTRRSKRELENAVEGLLAGESDVAPDGFDVAISHPGDDEDADTDADVTVRYQIVMRRDRAEREGVDILGPATVDGEQGDYVRVPWHYGDREGPQ